MPYEYEDESEIYRVKEPSVEYRRGIMWGMIIGALAAEVIILIALHL